MSNNDDIGEDKNKNGKQSYEVGYGKPPKHTRFGQIGGNPQNNKGRPAGRNGKEFSRLSEEAFWSTFHDAMLMDVPIRENGEELLISAASAIARTMVRDALKGDRHARKEVLRYTDKAVKGKDKLINDMRLSLASYQERKLSALKEPGSLECFDHYYAWFMVKKNLRISDGADCWPYEDGEPLGDEEWGVFLRNYDIVKNNPDVQLQWPVRYPNDIEAKRIENMSYKELAHERLREFKHRKEMREKEGVAKWKYLIEEPVDEQDWECFTQHINDILNDAKSPIPWPPIDSGDDDGN